VKQRLLDWYAEHGRDLPWRKTQDPYAILVSEVMLQQTQVPRVVPRYLEWLERWPTAGALAAAPRSDVILAWQGLGYNRRAVNLHRAAQAVAERGWPTNLTELPGVGPYTAAAIRCFAFGENVLPEDTNVRRVRERSGGSFDGECAQALMDLGATICLARVPRCSVCPLEAKCPSRGLRFEPARRQGPFEGSFRQRRSVTLRLVAEAPRRLEELDDAALDSLHADGLVVVVDGLARLPE
jgi:A/G-specific adenine glycosylase